MTATLRYAPGVAASAAHLDLRNSKARVGINAAEGIRLRTVEAGDAANAWRAVVAWDITRSLSAVQGAINPAARTLRITIPGHLSWTYTSLAAALAARIPNWARYFTAEVLGASGPVVVQSSIADFKLDRAFHGGSNGRAAGLRVSEGLVRNGDLMPWFNRLEITHTGNDHASTAVLTLDVPPDGTLSHNPPVLLDDRARTRYLVDLRIDRGNARGRLLRGLIGDPTVLYSKDTGYVIRIPVTEISIYLQMALYSRQDRLQTPQDHLIRIVSAVNDARPGGVAFHAGTLDDNREAVAGAPAGDPPPWALPERGLRQDWLSAGPRTAWEALQEIGERLAERPPATGGTITDYYFDFAYPSDSYAVAYLSYRKFGEPSDLRVVVDPTILTSAGAGAEDEQTSLSDNLQYRDGVVARGHPLAGTLPPNLSRFASEVQHAYLRPRWRSARDYEAGDLVQDTDPQNPSPGSPYTLRFYRARRAHRSSSSNRPHPSQSQLDWEQDFTTDPNTPGFFSPSPWTSDLGLCLSNLTAPNDINATTNRYARFCPDWNVERTLYDRPDPNDHYSRVSVKMVLDFAVRPPLHGATAAGNPPADGDRYIVGTRTGAWSQIPATYRDGSNPAAHNPFPYEPVTADGRGLPKSANELTASGTRPRLAADRNRGRIVEFRASDERWMLSDPPQPARATPSARRRYDHVICYNQALVLRWDPDTNAGRGGAGNQGVWAVMWQPALTATPDVYPPAEGLNPFHRVADARLVPGPTGVPDSALELRYDWLVRRPGGGVWRDPYARGAWLAFTVQQPRTRYQRAARTPLGAAGNVPRGSVYAADPAHPSLDFANLDRTADGSTSVWHTAKSEELGRIVGIRFKLRLTPHVSQPSEDSSTDPGGAAAAADVLLGAANMEGVWWGRDKFGRFVWQELSVPYAGQWTVPIEILGGPDGGLKGYLSRIDEVAKIAGFPMPHDFYLPEREYTGVEFAFEDLVMWGVMWKAPYNTYGLYAAVTTNWTDAMLQQWAQIGYQIPAALGAFAEELLAGNIAAGVAAGFDEATAGKEVDHVHIAIAELAWIKELYAFSGPTDGSPATRVQFLPADQERDYLSLRATAEAARGRRQFHPQFWHIQARGDPRILFGRELLLRGERVPLNEQGYRAQEVVPTEVKHVVDGDGYTTEFSAIRKYVYGGDDP